MVDAEDMKYWRDAGHVARRTLEAIKDEIQVGAKWHDIIESAERYIHRHGGKPAFPCTVIIAGGAVRAVMQQVGITDILTKNTGSTNNINVVKAIQKGFLELRDPLTVAKQRGIKLSQ